MSQPDSQSSKRDSATRLAPVEESVNDDSEDTLSLNVHGRCWRASIVSHWQVRRPTISQQELRDLAELWKILYNWHSTSV